jgi:hypothetical protein
MILMSLYTLSLKVALLLRALVILDDPIKFINLLEEKQDHVVHLQGDLLDFEVVIVPDDVLPEDGLSDLRAEHGEIDHQQHLKDGTIRQQKMADDLKTQKPLFLLDLLGLALFDELDGDR